MLKYSWIQFVRQSLFTQPSSFSADICDKSCKKTQPHKEKYSQENNANKEKMQPCKESLGQNATL